MRFYRAMTSSRGQVILVFLIFGMLALAAYWPVYPGDPSQLTNCGCGDVAQSVWYMEWGPYAIFHWISPLHTTIINYPVGSNLAISAEMMGISLPLAPVTYLLSPVATYNVAMWLSFPLAATTCFYVLRRWTGRSIPAFVGGLLFGFSPYMFGEGSTHLNLSFVAFVPLIYLATVELFIVQRNVRKWGILLGVFTTWQYFISSEVLLDTAVLAVIGLIIAAACRPRQFISKVMGPISGLGIALVIFIVVAGYPIWYSLFGPQHLNYPIQGSSNPFNSDLIGVYTPDLMERLYPASLKATGSSLVVNDWPENGSYLGVPLILLWMYTVYQGRRVRWIQLSVAMALIAFIVSLGPVVTIHGHMTSFKMPFSLVNQLPIFNNVLPNRFAMDVMFFVVVAIAFGFDAIFPHRRPSDEPPNAVHTLARHRPVVLIPGLVALLVVALSLIPTWPYYSFSTKVATPFSLPSIGKIKPASVMLTYPYPIVVLNQPMVWQAMSGMKFNLLGGYNLFTYPGGAGSAYPTGLKPILVEVELATLANPEFLYPLTAVPKPSSLTAHLLRRFVKINHAKVVVVTLSAPNGKFVESLFTRALRRSPVVQSGEATWILN